MALPRRIQREYSDWAPSYDATAVEWGYVGPQRIAASIQEFLPPDPFILDCGCGTGLNGALYPGRLTGVDIAAPMLALAKVRGYRVAVAEIGALPFPDDIFDAVLCTGVLDILTRNGPRIAEFGRVLKQGGIAGFTVTSDRELKTHMARRDVEAMVLRAGMEVLDTFRFQSHCPPGCAPSFVRATVARKVT